MYLLLLVLLSLAGLEIRPMWKLHTILVSLYRFYYSGYIYIQKIVLLYEQSQLYIMLEKSRLIKSCLLMKKFATPQSPHIIAILLSSKSSDAN